MKLAFSWRPFVLQSLTMALIVFVQWQTNIWTTKLVRAATFDRLLLPLAGFALLNLALVMGGDRIARWLGRSDRVIYMLIAAVAALVVHLVALAPAAYNAAVTQGIVSVLIVVPLVLGAATVFLLHRTLGYSVEGDEPDRLLAAAGEPGGEARAAYAATESAEYYSGPLQVCNSSMAALIAAATGSALFIATEALGEMYSPFLSTMISPKAFGSPATFFLSGIVSLTLPFYIFVKKSHAFLQARGKAELKSYIKAGLFVPGLFLLGLFALLGPFAVMVVIPWILPSMAAIAVYHRLAGFEPLALPDDIEVKDRRTLIAANHPRRQTRRIVGPQGFGKAPASTAGVAR